MVLPLGGLGVQCGVGEAGHIRVSIEELWPSRSYSHSESLARCPTVILPEGERDG